MSISISLLSYSAKAKELRLLSTNGKVLNHNDKFEVASSNDHISLKFINKHIVDHKGEACVNQSNDQVKYPKMDAEEGIDDTFSSQAQLYNM